MIATVNLSRINDEELCKFFQDLETNQDVVRLECRFSSMGNKSSQALSQALAHNTTIEFLDLEGMVTSTKNFSIILNGLSTGSQSLIGLDVSYCALGSRGINSLIKVLKTNPRLQFLYFRKVKVPASVSKALTNALAFSHLFILDITNLCLSTHQITQILTSQAQSWTLRELNMSHCVVDTNGCNVLASVLARNVCLWQLWLCNNNLVNQQLVPLFKALEYNTNLTILKISDNIIGIESAEALSRALTINTSLTSLSVTKMGWTGETFLYLTKALEENKTLRVLYCSTPPLCNNFNMDPLYDMIRKNTGLRKLHFMSFQNTVTDDMVQALTVNWSIRHICILSHDVDSAKEAQCQALTRRNRRKDALLPLFKTLTRYEHTGLVERRLPVSICQFLSGLTETEEERDIKKRRT